MKDSAISTGRPSKDGVRANVTGELLGELSLLMAKATQLWNDCDTPAEFMERLEEHLDGKSHTSYDRGNKHFEADNLWLTIDIGNGSSLRVTFSLNDAGQFTVDFRKWSN